MFVLIVGNDVAAQQELAQAIADFGLDWELEVAPTSAEALAMSACRKIDVAVVEMALDGGGGAALLTLLRAQHPDGVMILLLGEQDEANAMRALESAHRFLHKPLRSDELVDAVESVVELRELLASPRLKETIGRITSLPPAPNLYLRLTQGLNNPGTGLANIATIVSQDPVMAAKVLRLCNSAFFSGGRSVTDIRNAVVRLGQQNLTRLVLASEVFGGSSLHAGLDRDLMQQQSLRASQLAARLLDGTSSELAATAALLADVGKLLPGVYIPETESSPAFGDPSAPHYAEAGAYLLGMWGLPMPIVEAVANQRQPLRSRSRGFWVCGAVHVACALVSGDSIDEAYLDLVGARAKLADWRRMAQSQAEAA